MDDKLLYAVTDTPERHMMLSRYDTIAQLTSDNGINTIQRRRLVKDFAHNFQWQPSDVLEIPFVSDLAPSHLIVEHGLENTAVISFISNSRPYSSFDGFERSRLLSVSYNNLIDWHIHVEHNAVRYIYNRTRTPTVKYEKVSPDYTENLRSRSFEQFASNPPSPNVISLDDALIDTISYWKRELSARLGSRISNETLSSLFNTIIFIRAIEDQTRSTSNYSDQLLLSAWNDNLSASISSALFATLPKLVSDDIPNDLIDLNKLRPFDSLDPELAYSFVEDFYRHDHVPYTYNFALMSQHALSRIYERYVSILSYEETNQLTLPNLPTLPVEKGNKVLGSIYTPQFIARFFAKYLKSQMPLREFRNLRSIDPAVGSGIFLRTLLELQVDTLETDEINNSIEKMFKRVVGLDVDANAVQATKLSLSLLYLVTANALPKDLQVFVTEAINYYEENPSVNGSFDLVIANPPFIAIEQQEAVTRQRVANYMAELGFGRMDMYLAFIKLGVDLIKPGGYGFFVLPHSFLIAEQAKRMRYYLTKITWIRCLIDLSAIKVFGETGIYAILLIFQKKMSNHRIPSATIVKCQDLTGWALQATLEGQKVINNFYSIYDVEQSVFTRSTWSIPLPMEIKLEEKLSEFPTIDEFLIVRAGFVSGADDVFIVPEEVVPDGEDEIFVKYLPDRDMEVYTVSVSTNKYFFYPYINGELIKEKHLQQEFPKTWNYLQKNKRLLSNRSEVRSGRIPWWRPNRPRLPQNMMIPKIMSPHLTLFSKFSIDLYGEFAVSRSPILYSELDRDSKLLKFFVAVLNSTPCYWHISLNSHKYSGGYLMLEPKTLKSTPVPDPTQIDPIELINLVDLVDDRLVTSSAREVIEIEQRIEELVASLYGLSVAERRVLGIN